MVKRNRERLITLVVKRDREADECQFSDSYYPSGQRREEVVVLIDGKQRREEQRKVDYPSGQRREEVVVLIDGKQRREEQRKVDYPSEWRMNAPPWPDNAPHRPSIICAVALSDCPKDRRMWQKAESLETERQTRPSGGVNRLVNYPSGQTRQRE